MITRERLKEALWYSPVTGNFYWNSNMKRAGSHHKDYIRIAIDCHDYYAHQLAWLYMTGEWRQVDHKNRHGKENWFSNLRPANFRQNKANSRVSRNSLTGLKGVTYFQGRYQARIVYNYKKYHLGVYDTAEEAHAVYLRRAEELFGEFAHDGS